MISDRNESQILKNAAELIRKKQHQQAREILVPYIREHQDSEKAWFLLSYAINDLQKKAYSLEKVLEINPQNSQARDRLVKITKQIISKERIDALESPKDEIESLKSEKRIPWFTYPIVILLLILIGFITINKILPTFLDNDITPTLEISGVNPTNFIEVIQSETETSTESPKNTPLTETPFIPTATLVPTLHTREFDIPQGMLAQQMNDIQNQVATMRDLSILYDNPRYLISENQVYSILSEVFHDNISREAIKKQTITLQALGLIDPTYDLYSYMLDRMNERLGRFYLPITDEIFVVGDEFNAIEKFVYAHEYTHTLVDQHFNIDETSFYPLCKSAMDQCSAIMGLVDGDATFLMYRWLEAYASEDEIAFIESAQFSPIDIEISNYPTPPYFFRDASFRYSDGRKFVEFLYEKGGWALVNQAYQQLPDTTEKILHPEKYLAGESAKEVELVSINHILDDTWEHQVTTTLGELKTDMILGYNENYLFQLDPITSTLASSGWGGDQIQVYYQNRTYQNLLVAMWEWDSLEDRNEFWDAISEYLDRRYLGRKIQETEDTCWTQINDHFSCIYKWHWQTLWIKAPTMSLISQILAEYPDFR